MAASYDTPYDGPVPAAAPTQQSLEQKSVNRLETIRYVATFRNSLGLRLYLLVYG